jgi:hypothetical protein
LRFFSIAHLRIAGEIIVQARCPVLTLGPDGAGVSSGFAGFPGNADGCEASSAGGGHQAVIEKFEYTVGKPFARWRDDL